MHSSHDDKSLRETWRNFLRALKSPQPFNPFVWIFSFALALQRDFFRRLGLTVYTDNYKHRVLPIIPIFAISLVAICALSYPLSIRSVVKERWCTKECGSSASLQNTQNINSNYRDTQCLWIHFHDIMILYLPTMILFHFINACCSSPGVALAKNAPDAWMAHLAQGGFVGWNITLDRAAERRRVMLYGRMVLQAMEEPHQSTSAQGYHAFPTPFASYCKTCDIIRPPRAHHCSTSDRCVLQYDHFCIWLNNTVGYNNYRSFFLLLFYVMIACWYGVALLFLPFYEPLKARINDHGWRWLYSNGTGLLNLPPLAEFFRMSLSGTLPSGAVIDIIYPLLFGVGAIMSAFFGYHVKYVLMARTTLEHRVILDRSIHYLFHTGSSGPTLVNPFDQGWRVNLSQVLGRNLWLIFLPVTVQIPPPFVPKGSKHKRN